MKNRLARMIARCLRALLPARIMKRKDLFEIWQEAGYHVTPVHFYEPIPDTRTLKPEQWDQPLELPGIDLNEPAQLDLRDRFQSRYQSEYEGFPAAPAGGGSFIFVTGSLIILMRLCITA